MTESDSGGLAVEAVDPGRRLAVVTAIAFLISPPFAAVPLALAMKSIPMFESLFQDMGGPLPPVTQLLIDLSHTGTLLVGLALFEVAVFVALYALAKRYWIGLVFVAPLAYLAIAASLVLVLWWPMFDIVNSEMGVAALVPNKGMELTARR